MPLRDLDIPRIDTRRLLLYSLIYKMLTPSGSDIHTNCYPNFSHAEEDIEQALAAMEEALKVMQGEGLFDG